MSQSGDKIDRTMQISDVGKIVAKVMAEIPVCDIHTHLFDPAMPGLLLSGIDELLTYHYHVAELFRARPDLAPEKFWQTSKTEQADLVWTELFVEGPPLSEVGTGLVSLLSALGLDPNAKDLREARAYFDGKDMAERVDESFSLAGVREVIMTNDPLDPDERSIWLDGFERDPRFHAALRLDSAIMEWPCAVPALRELGYEVGEDLGPHTHEEVRRYLREWADRMGARYMAVSLGPEFRYPDEESSVTTLLKESVLPVALEIGLPVALMIGVKRQVNPRLGLAGDGVGIADVDSLERLASDHPDLRILATYLARENQHQLCVAARKFGNILPFGCWWFVNNPCLIREITSMRLDLLGPTFVPQHSDARVLEQVVFKWLRSRDIIGSVLAERYQDLARSGFTVNEAVVREGVTRMFDGSLIG